MKRFSGLVLFVGLAVLVPDIVEATRINEVSDSTVLDRAVRFFSFRDPSLRNALAGSMLLGVCCGLMGTFLVVRKLSLLGDALSHAVLPGVALGFLWNMSKDPIAIFVGATS
ncbi:MAG: metal ABC transporter permease, partial [Terrimicrobiaceae bacterium]